MDSGTMMDDNGAYCGNRRREWGMDNSFERRRNEQRSGTWADRRCSHSDRSNGHRSCYRGREQRHPQGKESYSNYELSREAYNHDDRRSRGEHSGSSNRERDDRWRREEPVEYRRGPKDLPRNNDYYENSYGGYPEDRVEPYCPSSLHNRETPSRNPAYRRDYGPARDGRGYYRDSRDRPDPRCYPGGPSEDRSYREDDRYNRTVPRSRDVRSYPDHRSESGRYDPRVVYSGHYSSRVPYEQARRYDERYTTVDDRQLRDDRAYENSQLINSEIRAREHDADRSHREHREYHRSSPVERDYRNNRDYEGYRCSFNNDEYRRPSDDYPRTSPKREGREGPYHYPEGPDVCRERCKEWVDDICSVSNVESNEKYSGSENFSRKSRSNRAPERHGERKKLSVLPERPAEMGAVSPNSQSRRSPLSLSPSPTPSSRSSLKQTCIPSNGLSRSDDLNDVRAVESLPSAIKSSKIYGSTDNKPSSSKSSELQEQKPTSSKRSEPEETLLVAATLPVANRFDKEKVTLTTNLFPLEVKNKPAYLYDITITVVAPNGRTTKMSKCEREKSQGQSRRNVVCVAAMKAALEAYGLIRSGEATLFDGGASMYSSESLVAVLKPHSNTLQVSISSLPANIQQLVNSTMPNAENIVIEFGKENQFNLRDYKDANTNRDLSNKTERYKQFFDVLTSEPALASGRYTAYLNGNLFSKSDKGKDVGNGEAIFNGIKKGIAFVQPQNSGMVPALVLDTHAGHFYLSQNAIKTVSDMLGVDWRKENQPFPYANDLFRKIDNKIKGLKFIVNSNEYKKATIIATGLSKYPISDLYEKDFRGRSIPVLKVARFAKTDVSGVRRHWPAIEVSVKIGRELNTIYYPMEFLTVAKNQKVPIERVDNKPLKARKIQEKFESIATMLNALSLENNSPHSQIMRAFGVSVSSKPLKIEAIKRELPTMFFKDKVVRPDRKMADFAMQAYIEPASINDIIVVHDCKVDVVQNMTERLAKEAAALGMKINRWHYFNVESIDGYQQKLRTAFTQVSAAQKSGVIGKNSVILYVDGSKCKAHALLKYFERVFLIVTQHITTEVAEKIYGKTSRINILNKLNCKLGGNNYSVVPDSYFKQDWITNGKSLIIGYDVAHPSAQHRDDLTRSTSVVGMSYNGTENPEVFVGDYHYQFPRREQVEDHILISRMNWMLKGFVKHRGLPENIFLLRDGVSSGQYNMVLNGEFKAIRKGVEEFKQSNRRTLPNVDNWQPKYVLLVVCKRHKKKFAMEEKQGVFTNALPGTVVDNEAVRKDMTHFYVLPHHASQGTAKFPSYHKLHYDLESETQDKLQAFLLALSFNHQISPNSTSLPEPVYQADEWAKRGNENFKVFKELEQFPRLETWDSSVYESAPIDYERLTNMLSYRGTSLEGFRLNA